MKTLSKNNSPQKLVGEIQMARLQVAKAESQLTSAKELARIARRRRKEAKQAARHAKKQLRLAKREFTDAKLVVAELEEKLARSEQHAVQTKAKPKLVKKVLNASRRKKLASLAVPKTLKREVVVEPKRPRARTKPTGKVTARIGVPRNSAAQVVHQNTALTATALKECHRSRSSRAGWLIPFTDRDQQVITNQRTNYE